MYSVYFHKTSNVKQHYTNGRVVNELQFWCDTAVPLPHLLVVDARFGGQCCHKVGSWRRCWPKSNSAAYKRCPLFCVVPSANVFGVSCLRWVLFRSAAKRLHLTQRGRLLLGAELGPWKGPPPVPPGGDRHCCRWPGGCWLLPRVSRLGTGGGQRWERDRAVSRWLLQGAHPTSIPLVGTLRPALWMWGKKCCYSRNASICEILTLCNIYSKADTHLKVIFNIVLHQFFYFIIIFLYVFPLSEAMLQWLLQYNSCFLSHYTIWQHLFFPSVNIITSHMEPVIAYRHLRETRIIQSVPFVSLIYIHKCHFNSAGNM